MSTERQSNLQRLFFEEGKDSPSKKHSLLLVGLVVLILKMSGKSLKNQTFSLHEKKAHKKVFSEVTIIGFKNTKSLKNHSVRNVLPELDREGRSKQCNGAKHSCEIQGSFKDTTKLKKTESKENVDILKCHLDCNSNNMIYLFEC